MKKFIFVVFSGLWISVPCWATTWVDVNLLGGIKKLSNADWGNNDTQGAVGFEAVVTPPVLPLSLSAVGGYLYTGDSSDHITSISGGGSVSSEELDAVTEEIWLGIGKKIDLPIIHFLVSGGPVFIRAREDQASTLSTPVSTDRDNGFGYYLSGSAFFQVLGHMNLGLQVRYSAANADLGGSTVKAGGMSYLGLLGIGF